MIEAVGLTKRYGRDVVVDDLSFTVSPGHVTGFLGPNGAGKSTTMRLILGLDRPTHGTARIDGKLYSELTSPLRAVGALLDATWVHPNRSARAHLRWLAASNFLPKSRVEDTLETVGLTAVADNRASTYSLGMLQRLGIAAAMLGDPEVLLLDEPVNGLDPEGIVWIRTLMKRLADEGRVILVSSHLLSEMSLMADELIVIGRGKLISQSSTEDFIARTSLSTLRVRSPQRTALREALLEADLDVHDEDDAFIVTGADSEWVGELAARLGIVLHELTPQRGSLEDAFMLRTSDTVEYRSDSAEGSRAVGAHARRK